MDSLHLLKALFLGVILAVMWIYRERIRHLLAGVFQGDAGSRRFATVIGALFIGPIKRYLFDPATTAA